MLTQIILDLFIVVAVSGLWIKRARSPQEDPRLSRGLQLLQTKISILEDLSDRTETQVHQLTALMEVKVKEIQDKMKQADKHLQEMEISRTKSQEVAKIFQDRIPHAEIIERQNTIKYVNAARLAHQGKSVDEIARIVDLSRGELEFIVKVNRDKLQFSEEDLPEWTKEGSATIHSTEILTPTEVPSVHLSPQILAKPHDAGAALSDLGQKFRQAIQKPAELASKWPVVESPGQAPLREVPLARESETPLGESPAVRLQPQMAASQAPQNRRQNIDNRPRTQTPKSGQVVTTPTPLKTYVSDDPRLQMGWNTKGDIVEVKKIVFPRMNFPKN
jgi:mannose/fructose/N-acetylgalactosamine-specific phosphotransferase system component IIB